MMDIVKNFALKLQFQSLFSILLILHKFIEGKLFYIKKQLHQLFNPKADPGPARQARAPPFEKKNGTFFGNFSLYIRKYFDFSQHAVFKICILFTTLLTQT